jgi:predicted transposase YdaD
VRAKTAVELMSIYYEAIMRRDSIVYAETRSYRALLGSDQFHRVYLDELGAIADLPLGVGLMVLTTVTEESAPEVARSLLERARLEDAPEPEIRRIMEMVTTIIVYKFTNLSRQEVDAMLGVSLQETRVYQEAKEEGREAGQRSLVLSQLGWRFGELPQEMTERVSGLSLQQLELLGKALLDFSAIADLEAWVANLQT